MVKSAVSASACNHNMSGSVFFFVKFMEYSPTTVYIISLFDDWAYFWNSPSKNFCSLTLFAGLDNNLWNSVFEGKGLSDFMNSFLTGLLSFLRSLSLSFIEWGAV